MKKHEYRNLFILADILSSGVAWSLFFVYRKLFIEAVKFGVPVPFHPDLKFFVSLVLIPAFWFLIYYSAGSYDDIRRKTHGHNAAQLFTSTFIGVVLIFFSVILDDTVISYWNYYESFLVLFALQFLLTFLLRFCILSYKNYRFSKNQDSFKVVVVGRTGMILRFVSENYLWLKRNSFKVTTYVLEDFSETSKEQFQVPVAGVIDLDYVLESSQAEEVFIITEATDKEDIEVLLYKFFRKDVHVRMLPELFTLIHMPAKITDSFNAPLLVLSRDILPAWQHSVKVFLDILLSIFAIVLLLPLIVILVIAIKFTSEGPVIYSQERVGKNGKLFRILKFRSMYVNAEAQGPMLATSHDARVTSIGRFMRKRRLDEIPNFINVFKGDMSLVGPRPERAFYIDQIIDQAPQYSKLHLVKPGITSWGQVKFGYAKNTEEMLRRMRYDLVYIENMSLFVDIQILFRTIGIIIKGQGV